MSFLKVNTVFARIGGNWEDLADRQPSPSRVSYRRCRERQVRCPHSTSGLEQAIARKSGNVQNTSELLSLLAGLRRVAKAEERDKSAEDHARAIERHLHHFGLFADDFLQFRLR